MNKDFDDLVSYVRVVEPPAGLYQSVLLAVKDRRKKDARSSIFFLSLTSVVSLVAIFPIFSYILNSFAQSGFYNYISLAFSGDIVVLASYWKDLVFSLVESAPFMGIALLLSAVAVFLWSLNKIFKNVGVVSVCA